MDFTKIGPSDLIACLALLVSLASALFTFLYGRSQHLVNQGLLADRKKSEAKKLTADVKVALTGNPNKYVVTFHNVGAHAAQYVMLNVGAAHPLASLLQFARAEHPFDLGPGETRRFLAVVTLDVQFPARFEIFYRDGRPNEQRYDVMLDLP